MLKYLRTDNSNIYQINTILGRVIGSRKNTLTLNNLQSEDIIIIQFVIKVPKIQFILPMRIIKFIMKYIQIIYYIEVNV